MMPFIYINYDSGPYRIAGVREEITSSYGEWREISEEESAEIIRLQAEEDTLDDLLNMIENRPLIVSEKGNGHGD